LGYTLYGRRQTGVMAIEAALAQAGVPFDFIDTPRPRSPEEIAAFAAINPRLQVPVLIHSDGTVITEGPAILGHIADAHPSARLAPVPGSTGRARHDRWLAYFHANVYEGMLRELFPDRYTTDPQGGDGVQKAATAYVRHHFQLFETELGTGPYLGGEAISVFDIYLWMLCYWIDAEWLVSHCPKIARLWTSATVHPALGDVGKRHFGQA